MGMEQINERSTFKTHTKKSLPGMRKCLPI